VAIAQTAHVFLLRAPKKREIYGKKIKNNEKYSKIFKNIKKF
jgi:hypothetical protein